VFNRGASPVWASTAGLLLRPGNGRPCVRRTGRPRLSTSLFSPRAEKARKRACTSGLQRRRRAGWPKDGQASSFCGSAGRWRRRTGAPCRRGPNFMRFDSRRALCQSAACGVADAFVEADGYNRQCCTVR